MINLFDVIDKVLGRSAKPKAAKAEKAAKPRKAKASARGAARAALQALTQKAAAPKAATYQGKPATGQFVDAPRPRDPWCRDDRRPAPGDERWVPERHWF